MTSKPVSRISILLGALVCAPGAIGDVRIDVGRNVHVSRSDPAATHYETWLAADRVNPRQLLGGSMVFDPKTNRWRVVTYVSADGGSSWQQTLDAPDSRSLADPNYVFGPANRAYAVRIGAASDERIHMGTWIHRSSDGGKSWTGPISLPFVDRPYLSVDQTGGKYHGLIYLHGVRGFPAPDLARRSSAVIVYSSADEGATFRERIRIAGTPENLLGLNGNSVVMRDGTFVGLFSEFILPPGSYPPAPATHRGWIRAVSSADGAKTFSAAAAVGELTFPPSSRIPGTAPMIAVDSGNGPFRDRLYAVWTSEAVGKANVLVASSNDKGKTWSQPVNVAADSPTTDNFHPAIAVDSAGVAGLLWQQRADPARSMDWTMRFAASLDGGVTFTRSVAASEAPFIHDPKHSISIQVVNMAHQGDPNQASTRRYRRRPTISIGPDSFYWSGGDTIGFDAAADGRFHAMWVDNRTGVSQVWSAPITVRGQVSRHGAPELDGLEDITNKLSLEFSNTRYNPATRRFGADAHVFNISDETFVGKVVARLLSFRTFSGGVVELVTSDNGERGIGALLEFTPENRNRLNPGGRSKMRSIEFEFKEHSVWRPGAFVAADVGMFGVVAKEERPSNESHTRGPSTAPSQGPR